MRVNQLERTLHTLRHLYNAHYIYNECRWVILRPRYTGTFRPTRPDQPRPDPTHPDCSVYTTPTVTYGVRLEVLRHNHVNLNTFSHKHTSKENYGKKPLQRSE
ncbi:hypothetical protein NP493_143g01024 [Ridgeia piscesae]|uniref:Uncharacterized protein n=1 Tax=Ridgeia piscesae TaxID=27915 RepID=A0AAD9UG20_RIDPI|nr:hypothetical protein NP493_143g01024 [Ridgeia piscesae]